MSKLPTWEQCERNVKNGSATALEGFIYENEPAGTEIEAVFRNGLAAVLAEAQASPVSASAVQPERCCLDYPRCDCNSPPEPDDDWLCFQRPAQPKVTP